MESGHLFTLSAYQHLLGTERYRALDNVLQELGRERTIAMSLPEFEQSLFMAAQPDNLLLATAPRYCQYYINSTNCRWLLFLSRLMKASKKAGSPFYPSVA